MQVIHPECFLIYPFLFQNYFKVQLWLPFPAPSYQIERAMAEIFTPATQPLWVAEWLLQPLWQSGWVAAPATLAAWLSGSSSRSGRVAVAAPATLGEWLCQSGWVAAPATAWLMGWVAGDWLLQPLWQSGCSSYSGRVAEWLLQPLWQSGWVAPPATLAELLSGWVAAAESSANEFDKVFKHFNVQARLYDSDSNLIYKHIPVNFNCHSYITFNVLIKNSHIYTLNYNLKLLKRKDSVDELYKFRIGNNYYINHREEPLKYKMIDGIDDVMSLKDEEEYRLVLKRQWFEQSNVWNEKSRIWTTG